MARLVALGDAHLGRQYHARSTPEGVNVREADFEASFEAAVELGLSLEPDVFVWLGDIFDAARPGYRAFRVAQRALRRLRAAGVPLVAISGNHDTPRMPGTGSPYAPLADTFGEFHFAFSGAYEAFDVAGARFHAVPQTLTVPDALDALSQAEANASATHTNVLLTHPRVPEVEPRSRDVNEIEIGAAHLRSDLVLLGHYHVHTLVREGVWYAGSTDTFSFGDDPGRAKGLVSVDTDTGACRHHAIAGRRPLVTPDPVAAAGLSPTEIEAALAERGAAVPAGAVVRVFVDSADPHSWRLVDQARVQDAFAHTLHVRLEPTFLDDARIVELPTRDAIGARWQGFLDSRDLTGYQPERLRHLGAELIQTAIDEA